MSASGALLAGRRFAESLMVDACTVRRRTGETTDPNTGVITPTTYTTLYTGKCRVQQFTRTQARAEDTGEARLLLLRAEVQLPMTVTGIRAGDEITVTASVHDADLVGRVFRARDLAHKTHATARRVGCEEVTS